MRLLAVEDCALLGRLLGRQACIASVLPIMQRFASDKSWRVRFAVAQHLFALCSVLGAAGTRSELLPAYVLLLRDPEAEVRITAAARVADFCALVGPEAAVQHILPCVKELAGDVNPHVRAALAAVIAGAAPVLGKQATTEGLLPLFLSLLKDDSPEVRLNIIGKLEALNAVVGVDLLSASLLPAVTELAEDRHWRVRLAIIEYIPALASQLGMPFFDDKLGLLCLSWLTDSVHAIREAAALNLRRLAEAFGAEWAAQHIVPQVLTLTKSPHYLYRATVLAAVGQLAPVVGADYTCATMLPHVVAAAKDRVPTLFQQALGPLKKGDTIYVAVGPAKLEKGAVGGLRYTLEEWPDGKSPAPPQNTFNPPIDSYAPQYDPDGTCAVYEAKQAAFNETLLARKPELVFLGDSITSRWPQELLEKHFGAYRPVNLGVGGDRVQNVIWRLQRTSLEATPLKALVLLIGTNNVSSAFPPEETAGGIQKLVKMVEEKAPEAKILILGVFPRGPAIHDPRNASVDALNAKLKDLADDKKVFYLDVGPSLAESDGSISLEVMPDKLHVALPGFLRWMDAMKPTLQSLLPDRPQEKKTSQQDPG